MDLVPGRECRECRACCQVFAIEAPGFSKPAGAMCAHAFGGGCGIYQTRPDPCRAFFCAWRQLDALPESARPDRLGAMIWVTGRAEPQTPFERLSLVIAAIDDPAVLDSPAVGEIVAHFARHSPLPIHLRWGDRQQLAHPGPDLARAILQPAQAPPVLGAQGRAWLAAYESFLAGR